MRLLILLPAFVFSALITVAQDYSINDSITEEGNRLYRSELTSWLGTDVFLQNFKGIEKIIGGYFSYEDRNRYTCVFFGKGAEPQVIGTVTFDTTFNTQTAQAKEVTRAFTTLEKRYFDLRKTALIQVSNDTMFKNYENTRLNLVPLVSAGENRVYVLTGTSMSGVVLLGNDYLLRYSPSNQLLTKTALHNNILPLQTNEEEEGKEVMGSMHTHIGNTSEYITATDICTLRLYGRFTKWKQHIVISEKFVSIWDMEKNRLVIIPKAAWDGMQEKENK